MIVDSFHGDPKLSTPHEDEGHKKIQLSPNRGELRMSLVCGVSPEEMLSDQRSRHRVTSFKISLIP